MYASFFLGPWYGSSSNFNSLVRICSTTSYVSPQSVISCFVISSPLYAQQTSTKGALTPRMALV